MSATPTSSIWRQACRRPLCKDAIAPRRTAQRRSLHRVPLLDHDQQFKSNGIPGFMSRDQFDTAWVDYQGYLVKRLNQLTQGTKDESAYASDLAVANARRADRASLFNVASMAHNNHSFFKNLSPDPKPMSTDFSDALTTDFSSPESFKATLLARANAMFGPGFVWLVITFGTPTEQPHPTLKLLTTYIAGSPDPRAHWRHQPVDMNTVTTNITKGDHEQTYATRLAAAIAAQNQPPKGDNPAVGPMNAGSFGRHAKDASLTAPGGQNLDPLMCVSTWEHCYIKDYGPARKREYLENWYQKIDWPKVQAAWNYSKSRIATATGKPSSPDISYGRR
ncbi:hypothetical protein MMC25_004774 [Agyrium rufum]|nr:hypothetical protein [Agyrium rufum]